MPTGRRRTDRNRRISKKDSEKVSNIFDYFQKAGVGRGDVGSGNLSENNEERAVTGRQGEVASGVWTDISARSGLIPVIGVIPDANDPRLLRSEKTGELVVWHNGRKDYRCPRKNIQPEEVVFDSGGAGWCPDCWNDNIQKAKLSKVFELNAGRMKSYGDPTRTPGEPVAPPEPESQGIKPAEEIVWAETPRDVSGESTLETP